MRTINRNEDNENMPYAYPSNGQSQLTKKEELAAQFVHSLVRSNPIENFPRSVVTDYGHFIGSQAVSLAEAVLGDREPEPENTDGDKD